MLLAAIATMARLDAPAQTNRVAVITTNIVTAVPWYREVNGRLYNTDASQLFQTINSAEIDEVGNGFVNIHWHPTEPITRSYIVNGSGIHTVKIGEKPQFDKVIMVLHLDLPDMREGTHVNFKALRVGRANSNGQTFELWDFGTPHRVTVVSTNWVKAPK